MPNLIFQDCLRRSTTVVLVFSLCGYCREYTPPTTFLLLPPLSRCFPTSPIKSLNSPFPTIYVGVSERRKVINMCEFWWRTKWREKKKRARENGREKIRAKRNPRKINSWRRRVAFWYQTSLIITQPRCLKCWQFFQCLSLDPIYMKPLCLFSASYFCQIFYLNYSQLLIYFDYFSNLNRTWVTCQTR